MRFPSTKVDISSMSKVGFTGNCHCTSKYFGNSILIFLFFSGHKHCYGLLIIIMHNGSIIIIIFFLKVILLLQ